MTVEREAVIKRLKKSESKIKKEIDKLDNEIYKMRDLCTTNAMNEVWANSTQRAVLYAKLEVLEMALFEIADIKHDIVKGMI